MLRIGSAAVGVSGVRVTGRDNPVVFLNSGWLQFGVAVAQSDPPDVGALATGKKPYTRPLALNEDEM